MPPERLNYATFMQCHSIMCRRHLISCNNPSPVTLLQEQPVNHCSCPGIRTLRPDTTLFMTAVTCANGPKWLSPCILDAQFGIETLSQISSLVKQL